MRKRLIRQWVETNPSIKAGNTNCTIDLSFDWFGCKNKIVCFHTANSKPVKQEVNGTVILPHLVFTIEVITLPTL